MVMGCRVGVGLMVGVGVSVGVGVTVTVGVTEGCGLRVGVGAVEVGRAVAMTGGGRTSRGGAVLQAASKSSSAMNRKMVEGFE